MTAPDRWRAHPAGDEVYSLGEGPVWDAARSRVLWVDIPAGTVHEGRLDRDRDRDRILPVASHRVDRTVGAVAIASNGDILVAATHDIKVLTADGRLLSGPRVLPTGARRRLNDGACDPAGRFLVGSMRLDEADGRDKPDGPDGPNGGEVPARIEPDGAVTVLDQDLNLSNGLAWSPDGTVFYSIDSIPGIVYARDYDAACGAVGPRRELLRTGGLPDGLCVDTEGCLWIAVWGTGEVRRYTAAGALIGVIETEAPHVTCPAFVGPALDRLLITTATEDLTPDQLERSPDSGRLLLADVGAAGLPTPAWSGWSGQPGWSD